MPYLVTMCIIPKNNFVLGHDVLYTEDEAQLSTSNNDSVGHGSINEEGQRNTNHVDTEEVVESDGVNALLGGYEFPDHCRLRQNLQSKNNRN